MISFFFLVLVIKTKLFNIDGKLVLLPGKNPDFQHEIVFITLSSLKLTLKDTRLRIEGFKENAAFPDGARSTAFSRLYFRKHAPRVPLSICL